MKNRILLCMLLLGSVVFIACPSPRMYYSVFLTDNDDEYYSFPLKEDLKCSIRIERNIDKQYYFSSELDEDSLKPTRFIAEKRTSSYVTDLIFHFNNISDNDINITFDNIDCFGLYNKKTMYKETILMDSVELQVQPKSEFIFKITIKFESDQHRYFSIKRILFNNISLFINGEKIEVSDLTFVKKHEKIKLH